MDLKLGRPLTRLDLLVAVSVLAAAILLHAAFPRYQWRAAPGNPSQLTRIDRWTGEAVRVPVGTDPSPNVSAGRSSADPDTVAVLLLLGFTAVLLAAGAFVVSRGRPNEPLPKKSDAVAAPNRMSPAATHPASDFAGQSCRHCGERLVRVPMTAGDVVRCLECGTPNFKVRSTQTRRRWAGEYTAGIMFLAPFAVLAALALWAPRDALPPSMPLPSAPAPVARQNGSGHAATDGREVLVAVPASANTASEPHVATQARPIPSPPAVSQATTTPAAAPSYVVAVEAPTAPTPPVNPAFLPTGTEWGTAAASGLGALKIANGTKRDAVVALYRDGEGLPQRAISVRAGDTVNMGSVATGTYEVRFSLGLDWDDNEMQFRFDSSFSEFEKPLSFTETRTGTGTEYYDHEVTLHAVPSGTAKTRGIPKKAFDLKGMPRRPGRPR